MAKKQLNCTVDEDILELVEVLRKPDRRSRSNMVNTLLGEAIEARKKNGRVGKASKSK